MIDYYELIKAWSFNGEIAFWTYWLPLILCGIGYSGRTITQIKELKSTEKGYYVPSLTVGQVVWRILATVTPVINVISLTFSVGWPMLSTIGRWLEKTLSYELVKK